MVEIDITGVGTKSPTSQMRWDDGAARRRALSANANAVTNLATGLDIQFQSASSIDVGSRPGGTRYISVTYQVRNGQFCSTAGSCTAYTVPRSNLTFLAVIGSTAINSSAITRFTRFDGSPAAASLATQLIPTHGMNATATAVDATRASMQVYRENELPAADPSVTDVLPYGFVVNNVNNGSRTLPASPAVNQFDGQVTFAFKIPLQATAQDDPFKITMRFQVLEDSNTRVTQSLEDTDASVNARAAALGSSDTAVLCNRVASVPAGNPICQVRLAGTAASPMGFINTPPVGPPVVQVSPNNLNNVPTTAELVVGTSQPMNPPSATSLVVHGSMSGMRTLTGAYAGTLDGGTATRPNQLVFKLAAGDKPFFRGEQVSFSATAGNTGAAGGALAAFVGSYRTQGSIAGTGGGFPGRNFEIGPSPTRAAVGDLNGDGKLDMVVTGDSNQVRVLLSNGSGGFSAATNFTVGSEPVGVALGDVNGDGKLDIVVANRYSDSVSVLMGNGTGGFSAATNFAVALGSEPLDVALGDVNGDGKLDIVLGNSRFDNVSVMLGNGVGSFSAATDFAIAVHSRPVSVALGDLNGDGKLDIVTANLDSNSLSVLLGDGIGGFAAPIYLPVGSRPVRVALANLNGDGRLDIVVANSGSGDVSVLLSDGSGGFAAATNIPVGLGTSSVALGDLNGDGKLDIVVTNPDSESMSLLLGNGSGGFEVTASFSVGSGGARTHTVALGDVNGDGKLDGLLVHHNGGLSHVSVLLGTGTGSYFAVATNFNVGSGPSSLTLADLNRDGNLDMVVTNEASSSVSVLLGNGLGGFATATNFTTGLSPISAALADLNGDGNLDMVLANRDSDRISVLLGNGLGSFSTATDFAVALGAGGIGVVLGDVNGDGRMDVVAVNPSSGDVSVLLGDGSGSFTTASNFNAGSQVADMVLGDLNGDGKLDIVALNFSSSKLNVLLGSGNGSFTAATTTGVGSFPRGVALGDVNGDGKLDAVVANLVTEDITVLLGNGNGGFSTTTTIEARFRPAIIALHDVNGDGRLDIVTANDSNNVSVLLGNGSGGFGTAANFTGGNSVLGLALGDVNGDGKLDIVIANYQDNNVTVLLGQ